MKFLLFTILLFAILFFPIDAILAVSDSVNINLQVTGPCNNNGICQPDIGETEQNCDDCAVAVSGGGYALTIYGVWAKPGLNSAEIFWRTNRPALCQFFWGRTSDYEKEIISETTSDSNHLVKLEELEAQFVYHYRISCSGIYNTTADTADYTFSLLSTINNVNNFSAVSADKKIVLSWLNPADSVFLGVRIIRNEKFYPLDVQDGIIIYDGYEKSFTDINLENGKRYYYTAFSYDKFKNYSSGALASSIPQAIYKPEIPVELLPVELLPIAPVSELPYEIEKITLESFNLFSDGVKIPIQKGKPIKIEAGKSLLFSISLENPSDVLKTIMLVIEKENEIYSFFFKPNEEKNVYSVSFFSMPELGDYPFKIIFLNDRNQILKELKGQFEVYIKKIEAVPKMFFLWWLWLILLALIILFINRKSIFPKMLTR